MPGPMPGKRKKVISENNDRMTSAEWTELTLSELVRLAEDGNAHRSFVHKVVYPDQTSTEINFERQKCILM